MVEQVKGNEKFGKQTVASVAVKSTVSLLAAIPIFPDSLIAALPTTAIVGLRHADQPSSDTFHKHFFS
jgi:hypothetical protein